MLKSKKKQKWVYLFGNGKAEGKADMKALLGGKGANLAEMNRIKLPVPPGFTITTEACSNFYQKNHNLPDGLEKQVHAGLKYIEKIAGGRFGHEKKPLLLSVRSGARVSMPGMMDTVLNLGLNDKTAQALANRTHSHRFAYDSYRRFIQIYGEVVRGLDLQLFEDQLEQHKLAKNYALDTDMRGDDWRDIVDVYKEIFLDKTGAVFPQDPYEQLWSAVKAVFLSWDTARAKTYRRLHAVPHHWGTAVNIQAMVFGNMGEKSATGVAFTRNPSNGENEFYGEFLMNAQGEDVVAGLRTPSPLTQKAQLEGERAEPSMEELLPKAFTQLVKIRAKLERHYRDVQDIEFTVEEGRLWMLQTRSAKRTASATIRCASDMVDEGLIDKKQALLLIDPLLLDQLLHPILDPKAERHLLTKGLPASPGAASGEVVFNSKEAETLKSQGRRVILVRQETSPEDIHGMHAAEGILTARGGMTSHAAVIARGMGRACVTGASSITIHQNDKIFEIDGKIIKAGDIITLDGAKGEVFIGEIPRLKPQMSEHFKNILSWADQYRRMKIRTNAETPDDARMALSLGAQGIGLCRTEHMFFDAQRISYMRKMILAQSREERCAQLDNLLPLQRQDFIELFKIMKDLPVTIRLLDPPLHEFLPLESELAQAAKDLDVDEVFLTRRVQQLSEANPMLGHRGCRLGISYPEIYEMQVRAILEAALFAKREEKIDICPEIMIPLVSMRSELDFVKNIIEGVAKKIAHETKSETPYSLGTMIELPRAALCADELSDHAAFFSFGTNDLTQTTYGISRDDSARFLGVYGQEGFFIANPFISIDVKGVGALMKIALDKIRLRQKQVKRAKDIKLGLCGEHGGDPTSISFCEDIGLDYISCSPYRVPIARLAAAQAALSAKKRSR